MVALFLSVYVVPPSREAQVEFPENTQIIIAIGRTIAFIMGASFSLLVGQLGNARESTRHFLGVAESLVELTIETGVTTEDSPFIDAVTETVSAETLEYTSRLIERKLADFGVQVKDNL